MATFHYFGHGSFRIVTDDGTVVYIDPFAGVGYDIPADLVLVTHEHGDHNRINKMPHAAGCEILRATDFLPAAGDYHTLTSHGIRMTPVSAVNKNHPIDQCVGIVIEFDGMKFYAAGDTSTTPDMESGRLAALQLDYATLPGDGYFNMGPEEGSRCAQLIGAKHYLPIHLVPVFDMSNPPLFSRETAESFTAPGRLIVEPGQTIEL